MMSQCCRNINILEKLSHNDDVFSSDKDSRCRFRLHYPGASWHTAYDVCAKENKTLARVSSEKLNILEMVLNEVNLITEQILRYTPRIHSLLSIYLT